MKQYFYYFSFHSTKLNNIKRSNEILENVIQLVELIWFALSVDMKRLNNRVDNSSELNSATESVNLRIVSNFSNQTYDAIHENWNFILESHEEFEQFESLRRDRRPRYGKNK